MKSKLWLCVCFFVFKISSMASAQEYPLSANNNPFDDQLRVFPQEKIHLHMDKSYYLPGENIWFRAYLINSASHKPESISRYIYVELINPLDSVVKRVKIITDTVYSGYLTLEDELPEGNYFIRAYTYYMQNLDEDYFFKKPIRIGSPFSTDLEREVNFSMEPNGNIKAEIAFKDKVKSTYVKPEIFQTRINNGPVTELSLKRDNSASFSFKLPSTSKYRVMYIEFDEYKQYVDIPIFDADFDVSFFPEGGYLLEGTLSRIAFKALKQNGSSEEIKGRLLDNDGNELQKIESIYKGMGTFSFIPESGKTYYAECRNNQGAVHTFKIPEARTETYTINAQWRNDNLFVSVKKALMECYPDTLYLLIHSRGVLQYNAIWDFSKEYMVFNSNSFPSGVIHLLLVDTRKNVLSERLVFCKNEDQAALTIKANHLNYNPREKVNLEFVLKDSKNKPVQGEISVAVTDDHFALPDTSFTIFSNLLLTSELKGYIEAPESYFRNDPKAAAGLDLLMMTHGWRRYNIPELIKGVIEEPRIPVEIGQQISGSVKTIARGRPVSESYVNLYASNMKYANAVFTDSMGNFYFDLNEFPNGVSYMVRAESSKGKDNIELLIDKEEFPAIKSIPVSGQINVKFYEKFIEYIDPKYESVNAMWKIHLKEVIVSGRKEKKLTSPFSHLASASFSSENIEESGFFSIKEILSRIAGVTVSGDNVFIRGSMPVLVIDGVEMVSVEPGGGPTTISISADGMSDAYARMLENANTGQIGPYLDNIHIDNVEKIEIYKGVSASFITGTAFGGAIVVTTKDGKNIETRTRYNLKQITPLGYQEPVEFYSPKYDTPAKRNKEEYDLRTTIYWNPQVKIPENGKNRVEFYTADVPSIYSVLVEGITREGEIIRNLIKISTR